MLAPYPASLALAFPDGAGRFVGTVPTLSMDDYQAADALSNGGLGMMARSPAHLFAWTRDAGRPPRPERAGQLEGTLAHCLILEPGEFPFRYAVGPDVSRATKEWKEWAARQSGRILLKPDQLETAQRQAASVRADPDIAKLLAKGDPEVSAFWVDPATRVLCKCRPDWVHPVDGVGVILLDIKTYSDAAEFEAQVARKRYHWQAAWYTDGYSLAAGVPVLGFVFVAVETEWPHACRAVMLTEESLAVARREIAPLVTRYAACLESNTWPGYPRGIEQIGLPRWYLERFEGDAL